MSQSVMEILHLDVSQLQVVPMWVVYQFLVSVVLLRSEIFLYILRIDFSNQVSNKGIVSKVQVKYFRILIVMLTITYRKVYDTLDTQWK